MRFLHVVGARPNFMKLAPVFRALARRPGCKQTIVHTGQHYDQSMSQVFFDQLKIPQPDVNLEVRSASHAEQTAEIMCRFEKCILKHHSDIVLVYGDVNSTLAATLVCSKLGIKLGHVEAGLRAFDRTMPEEINRLVTDQLADFLFTPSEDANINLLKEGIPSEKIHLVGNVMIDTLIDMLPLAASHLPPDLPDHFALLTLHRPANVDDAHWLVATLSALNSLGSDLPVLFPVHPRTRQRMRDAGLNGAHGNVKVLDPQPYLSFLALQQRASVVITDSGGIQEESTYLGIPCLTVRDNTERPVTVTVGTNTLVGRSPDRLREALQRILRGEIKTGQVPPLWDGTSSVRIAEVLVRAFTVVPQN